MNTNAVTNGVMTSLASLGNGIKSRRCSSYDTTGGNADFWTIHMGETLTLADISGSGSIRHIWMTTFEGKMNLRGLVLRIYWDGEVTPSIQCPLGDFFGMGHGQEYSFNSAPLQTFHLGMNCWFTMPFNKSARVTIENQGIEDAPIFFYIDHQLYDKPVENIAYFHANWRRELVVKKDEKIGPNAQGKMQRLNTTGKNNFLVLDVEGKGHYVGTCLHLDSNEYNWWGEGDDMFFIDGESWPPNIHGTGMEDYFCGAWNYNRLSETYNSPYFGYHLKGNNDYTGKHSQYRFHILDPIYFEKSLRFSIEHGHGNDMQGDWTSTAYWYQIDRKNALPDLGTFDDRLPFSSVEALKNRKDLC